MFQSLRTVIYSARQLAEARAWYAQVLGQEPYFNEPYYVGFQVGGYELGLDPNAPAAGQSGVVAYWRVADAPAAFAHLLALGATAHEAVHDVGGGIWLGTVRDPFGNLLGIIHEAHP